MYNGFSSLSASGRVCEHWSLTNYSSVNTTFLNNNLRYNYCRNPHGIHDKPWCVTNLTSYAWEPCNISKCTRLPITSSNYPLGREYINNND